ncbi:hypothetical protein DFQ14_102244 [Halopolyspora algeriensis]|uniref:Uncharacterized protein n=1 Tax=Halopolyspora algeriensis TaxID=1500506 RepID=A0A368VYP0_9ACTN|nr:hypothetical protein [Halopolyspora algeriensis]RCW45942.1 hypothetical protein DFQ14_102244 [Halopolyspora algeriensis]TQM55355.1 hypothetical protein FHU43_0118 [Halopolyspora algeriensis]
MSERDRKQRFPVEDEPDFAEEHTRSTYAEENAESPGMSEDEAVPEDENTGGQTTKEPKRPL